jgi:Pyruvate/2-oxoacid:ferredoxin oxidoreductase delta subunit
MKIPDALRVVLYEGPGSAELDAGERYETMLGLLEDGYSVTRPLEGGSVAPADEARHVIVGRFDAGDGAAARFADRAQARLVDLGGRSGDEVRAAVGAIAEEVLERKPGSWKPWFPVIDFDRCTNCMQCLSFCLFDVYAVDDKQLITVQHESNCKTDCPACSRVCPEAAILFPKYKKGPINGDVVRKEDLNNESMKVDISALLGGDIYASLRTRSTEARKRFSSERDDSRALLERKRCLKKLQHTLDIPDEVLMTLPSAESIEEKARRAREKADKRRARSKSVQDLQKPPPTDQDWGI